MEWASVCFCFFPFYSVSSCFIPFHSVLFRLIPFYSMSFRFILFHPVSFHLFLLCSTSFCFILFNIKTFIVLHRTNILVYKIAYTFEKTFLKQPDELVFSIQQGSMMQGTGSPIKSTRQKCEITPAAACLVHSSQFLVLRTAPTGASLV